MNAEATRRVRLIGLGAVALALLLTIAGVPATSAQGATINAVYTTAQLPVDDPFAAGWDAIRPVDVALSGQAVTPPMRLEPSVAALRVRAMANDDTFAVLVEWPDATKDDGVLRVEAFADAVAMQFGLGTGSSICMGQQAGGLNIWHWKADWAADLERLRDLATVHPNMPEDPHWPVAQSGSSQPGALGPEGFLAGREAGNPRSASVRPSSVEDLNAVGFGTLTPQGPAGQDVHGASGYRDRTWRVVMSRRLDTGDGNDAALATSKTFTVAFAVWDGARGDRDGQKSVSNWLALVVPTHAMGLLDEGFFLVMIVLALGLAGWMIWLGARQPAVGLSGPK